MPFHAKSSKLPVAEVAVLHTAPALLETPVRPLPAAPWSEADVETSHGRIRVRTGRGDGVVVLLLHGHSSSLDVFANLMSGELRHTCRMIALDLPGHGASGDAADPQRTYSVSGYADAVIEVLDQLDEPHVALVGWSLGGTVALEIATRFPGVLGVMLCGAAPVGASVDAIMAGFEPSLESGLIGQATLLPAEVRALSRLMTNDAGDQRAIRGAITRTDGRARALIYANLLAGGVPDQRRFVAATTLPIAVVNGADDPVVNVGYLTGLDFASLWYGRIHLIRDGGHAPFLTQSRAFEKTLARFIRSMTRRAERASRNPDLCFSG